MPANINLLQNQLTQDKNLKTKRILGKVQNFAVLAIIIAVIVGGVLYGWNYLAAKSVTKMQAQIQEQEQRLATEISAKRDPIVHLQSQVSGLQELLPQHVYWTNLLTVLNESAIQGIQFTGITSGLDGYQSFIDGFADDLTVLAAFTQRLNQKEEITSVSLNSVALAGQQERVFYRFTIKVGFDPEILNFSE